MGNSVSYEPSSGLEDAAAYKTAHLNLVDELTVVTSNVELSRISWGYGGHVLQTAIENLAEEFELRAAKLDVLGNQLGGLMASEIIQMVETDKAAADDTAVPS